MAAHLVTGPDGWLGSRLVESLRGAYPGIEIRGMTGDLRNRDDISGVDFAFVFLRKP